MLIRLRGIHEERSNVMTIFFVATSAAIFSHQINAPGQAPAETAGKIEDIGISQARRDAGIQLNCYSCRH